MLAAERRAPRSSPASKPLSTEALALFRKGITAVRNVALLRHCRRYGVSPDWNILVSIPGESAAIYDQYLRGSQARSSRTTGRCLRDPVRSLFSVLRSSGRLRADRWHVSVLRLPVPRSTSPGSVRVALLLTDPQSHAGRRERLGDSDAGAGRAVERLEVSVWQ